MSTETGNTLAGTYNPMSMHLDGRWLDPRPAGAYGSLFGRLRGGPILDRALVGSVGWSNAPR